MQILRFGTCQLCIFYLLLVFCNIDTPNYLSTAIVIQLITVAIGGSFVFYTNFNHYRTQYSNFSKNQLIFLLRIIFLIVIFYL